MTNPSSRNEIESALDANKPSSSNRSRSKPQQVKDLLDRQDNRERNVIGGDLTGISSRRKPRSNWLNFQEYNYVNWIAGLIVIMIAAVFFWPEKSNNSTEQSLTIKDKEVLADTTEQTTKNPSEQTIFSRNDDLERANQFRDEAVTELRAKNILVTAKALLRKGHYSTPTDNNAIAKFKQVLVLDPKNSEAKQGLNFIKNRYLVAGERAIESGNIASASANLKKIAIIDNQSEEYQALASRIELWQLNQQVEKLLAQAEDAIKKDQLIRPAQQSARFFYSQILDLEPNNTAALEGIGRIAKSFIQKTEQAIKEKKYDAASGYLTTVSVIDAQHPTIAELESAIRKAKASSSITNTAVKHTTAEPKQTNNSSTAKTSPLPTTIKSTKTPASVTQERELIDRQYLQRGLDAYYRGDYEVARSLLKPLADKGVSRAQLRLGYMYLLGRGVEKNRNTADQIIRAALPAVKKFADEGRAWAQSDIGSLYEDGLVLPQNLDEAIFWYQSAARQGYAGAQTNLGVMYAEGKGVTRNSKTAIDWFKKAAAQGDIAAKKNLKALNIKP